MSETLSVQTPIEPVKFAAARADELFADSQRESHTRIDRLFAGLMVFQWLLGIVFSILVSPLAWEGAISRPHLHVWAAVVLGGTIRGRRRPPRCSRRCAQRRD